jgi:hypothetical protein
MDQFPDLDNLAESGLTVSYICNAISPPILGVRWCMSSKMYFKVYGALGSIPSPNLIHEEIVAIIISYLSGLA